MPRSAGRFTAMLFPVVPLILVQGGTEPIGAALEVGMQLVYSANGRAQPPWLIDSAVSRLAFDRYRTCVRILLRRRPVPAPADETRLCVSGDTLFSWSSAEGAWRPQRPVAPGMQLSLARGGGDTVRYSTGSLGVEMISGRRVSVLETIVLTVDSLGRPKRRLRERYAPGLATATGGRFEVPDPAAPEGWRTEQAFELTEIRAGPG